MIEDLGGEVAAWAETLEDATRLASSQEPDVAILDINLKGEASYAAARILAERDRPFFFVTGFAHVDVPESLSGVPVVAKPYTYRCIGAAVEKVLGAGASGESPA
jgi:DNA-binding NarL/FixJ family response regulator